MGTYTAGQLNDLSSSDFVGVIGPVFELSPWIAEATWHRRPFDTAKGLHRALCDTVRNTGEEKQLELIRAHPDLVGRAALAGTLTPSSTAEQSSAGLNKLSPKEVADF